MVAAEPLTHIEALDLDRLPEHLIVLGGGYVGLEFAQRTAASEAASPSSSAVHSWSVVRIPTLLMPSCKSSGPKASRCSLRPSWSGCRVGLARVLVSSYARLRVSESIEGSDLLVAAGRTPNTAGIGLEAVGVELDARGYIKVNDRLETTAPDVWAIGECAGSAQFTHVSYDDFRNHPRQSGGGLQDHAGSLNPLLHLHRPRSHGSESANARPVASVSRCASPDFR